MSEIFFTADTHFSHRRMLELRNFEHTHEMDEFLIKKWNETVSLGDIVYHLGDVSFGNSSRTSWILHQLNGTIRLVKGNHDKKSIKGNITKRFNWIKDYYEAKGPDDVKIVLSHYAFIVWNKSHYGSWHLHGHSHGSLKDDLRSRRMDVGIDTRSPEFAPYSIEEVHEFMKNRQGNIVDHHKQR